MSVAIAALVALLLSAATIDQGGCTDPDGARCSPHASAVSAYAGVRIDPEG
jgi:hypothetical protein